MFSQLTFKALKNNLSVSVFDFEGMTCISMLHRYNKMLMKRPESEKYTPLRY